MSHSTPVSPSPVETLKRKKKTTPSASERPAKRSKLSAHQRKSLNERAKRAKEDEVVVLLPNPIYFNAFVSMVTKNKIDLLAYPIKRHVDLQVKEGLVSMIMDAGSSMMIIGFFDSVVRAKKPPTNETTGAYEKHMIAIGNTNKVFASNIKGMVASDGILMTLRENNVLLQPINSTPSIQRHALNTFIEGAVMGSSLPFMSAPMDYEVRVKAALLDTALTQITTGQVGDTSVELELVHLKKCDAYMLVMSIGSEDASSVVTTAFQTPSGIGRESFGKGSGLVQIGEEGIRSAPVHAKAFIDFTYVSSGESSETGDDDLSRISIDDLQRRQTEEEEEEEDGVDENGSPIVDLNSLTDRTPEDGIETLWKREFIKSKLMNCLHPDNMGTESEFSIFLSDSWAMLVMQTVTPPPSEWTTYLLEKNGCYGACIQTVLAPCTKNKE